MKNSPYIPSTDSDKQDMLEIIGADNFKALLNDVPEKTFSRTQSQRSFIRTRVSWIFSINGK